MTDSNDPLDELASAHLDGVTTAAEAARVGADPELQQRVALFGQVGDLLRGGARSPADEVERERAIAAALDAFDESSAEAEATAATSAGVVVPLASKASSTAVRAIRWVGIAAAVALLALTVPFLDRLDSGSNDQAATGLDATREDAATGGTTAGRGAGDEASSDALALAPLTDPEELGSFVGIADLAESVRSRLTARASAMETTTAPPAQSSAGAQSATCEAEKASVGASIVYSASATLDGRAVIVVVRDDSDGGQTMIVLDRESCATVSAGKL